MSKRAAVSGLAVVLAGPVLVILVHHRCGLDEERALEELVRFGLETRAFAFYLNGGGYVSPARLVQPSDDQPSLRLLSTRFLLDERGGFRFGQNRKREGAATAGDAALLPLRIGPVQRFRRPVANVYTPTRNIPTSIPKIIAPPASSPGRAAPSLGIGSSPRLIRIRSHLPRLVPATEHERMGAPLQVPLGVPAVDRHDAERRGFKLHLPGLRVAHPDGVTPTSRVLDGIDLRTKLSWLSDSQPAGRGWSRLR